MLNTIEEESFFSPEELAKSFKLSLTSIYKLVRSGQIPSVRLGKIYRIPKSELERYLNRQLMSHPVNMPPKVVQKFLDLLKASPIKADILEVYLYGSYARGEFDEDSDIDLCVIVKQLGLKTRNLLSSFVEKAMAAVDYGELLSLREETAESWDRMRKEQYPLVQNILREGIPLWKNH